MKTLRIAVDIDDTITETFEYMMPYVAEFYHVELEYLKKNNISTSSLTDDMREKQAEFMNTYFESALLNVPIKEGAVFYLKKLKALGHKIFIVTARCENMCRGAYEKTKEFLEQNQIPFDELINDYEKAKVCKEKKIDILIDDSVYNCEMVQNEGIPVLLFDCKSNENETVEEIPRVYNWEEIYCYLQNMCLKL